MERVESVVDAQTMAALSPNPAVGSVGADLGNARVICFAGEILCFGNAPE